jgi:hypothetical protein
MATRSRYTAFASGCLASTPLRAARPARATGAPYRCGQEAAFALADKIGPHVVSCERRDTDRYGRTVAVCTAGGVDLIHWMVAQGEAIAYRHYSLAYVPDEDKARAAKLGLWAGEFENPADFRHGAHPGYPRLPRIATRRAPSSRRSVTRTSSTRVGRCRQPDDLDKAGHRCGRRSAASKAAERGQRF